MLSKVKTVKPTGSWEGQYGKMYKFWYVFEDGTEGTANHKAEGGFFQPGTEVEYEASQTTHPQDGKKLKVSKPKEGGFQSGGKKIDPEAEALRQRLIVAQSSQAHAVTILQLKGIHTQSVTNDQILTDVEELTKGLYQQVYQIAEK